MLKQLIPLVLMVFLSACANTQSSNATGGKMPCCEKCECCKTGDCATCCKNGQCACCKDGQCCCKGGEGKMCQGIKGSKSASNGEDCPMCAKAEREWQAKQGSPKH